MSRRFSSCKTPWAIILGLLAFLTPGCGSTQHSDMDNRHTVSKMPLPSKLSLTPNQVTLFPAQVQVFTVSFAGATDKQVTWSVSPAVGSISTSGIYTSPASVIASQAITITATSKANVKQFAAAHIELTPMLLKPTTLRHAAAERGLLIGSAANADELGELNPLVLEPIYGQILGREYEMLEPENALKWIVVHPDQQTYNFEPADQLVAFAQSHLMKVRGHNLTWHTANPEWLTVLALNASSAVMAQTLQQHINTVMSHYRGEVFAWDVVNEAIDDSATNVGTQMKDSIWYNSPGIGKTGTGYVEQAFRWAHEADPNALLFYNDYNIYVPGPKFQALLNMLGDFLARGVPINGVGMEMHIGTNGWPDSAGLALCIQQLTALGLQVHITEMDVALPVPANGSPSPNDLEMQAQTYQRILTVCLQNPGCTAFQTWGFTDAHSWIPAYVPGYGAALPFDLNYAPKPAYSSILNTLLAPPIN